MLKILRSQFPPFIGQMHYLSGIVVSKQFMKKTKPIILCKLPHLVDYDLPFTIIIKIHIKIN